MSKEHETRESSQHKNEESSNHFLLGALIGGFAGALTALLLAPKSGKELRSALNSQAGLLMGKTSYLRTNVMNKSSQIAAKTQDLARQSTELLSISKNKMAGNEEETETRYIPIGESFPEQAKKMIKISPDDSDIRKKLAEAEKAMEEEENKVKQ